MEIGSGSRTPRTTRSEPIQNPQPAAQNTPPAETEQAPQTTPTQQALQADGFEETGTQPSNAETLTGATAAEVAPGTGTEAAAGAPTAPTEETAAAAQDILETGRDNPSEATHALGERLRDPNTTQEQREALVTELIEQDPYTAAQILNQAGQDSDRWGNVTDEDRQIISQTVGQAWERSNPPGGQPAAAGTDNALDAQDLRALISPANMSSYPEAGAQPHNIGNALGASGSASLQQSAATQMYDIGKEFAAGRDVDGALPSPPFDVAAADSYMSGAALAASGSPQAAQALMDHVASAGGVQDFVNRTSPVNQANTHGPVAANALGKLMQAVGNQPATPAADQFFDEASRVASTYAGKGRRHVGAEEGVQELQQGLSQYFQTNMEHTTTRWASSDQIADRSAYANFASNVLFGDSFEGQKDLQAKFSSYIGQRAGELQNAPVGDPNQEEKARQLGFLIGGAEVGFQRALGRVKDTNAARDAMVDFVFGIAEAAATTASGGAIPNFKFGPVDVRGTITNELKDRVKQWVHEESPDANEMTRPLYELGLSINRDYQDEMQSIRGSFADDERYGYLK